jgi:hypothetical protein
MEERGICVEKSVHIFWKAGNEKRKFPNVKVAIFFYKSIKILYSAICRDLSGGCTPPDKNIFLRCRKETFHRWA